MEDIQRRTEQLLADRDYQGVITNTFAFYSKTCNRAGRDHSRLEHTMCVALDQFCSMLQMSGNGMRMAECRWLWEKATSLTLRSPVRYINIYYYLHC